jgi:3',5'-cyclic-AMP phosphodiesterase
MKFIYLADTHVGGSDNEGYRKQPRYLKYFQEIIECLKNYINDTGDIDFIIHGGDMVDKTTPGTIKASGDFFNQLPCPTYLVLGNHDLTELESISMWLKYAPQFFPEGKVDFRLIKDGVQLDALQCNWCEIPAYWSAGKTQTPWFTSEQFEQISEITPSCHTQIIAFHSPMYGLPTEQHGGTQPSHAPAGDFSKKLSPALVNASLVLGAHNHMNMAIFNNNCHYVTTPGFSEMPFEFKVIEATRQKLSMQTVNLNTVVPFHGEYDFDSTYVQGRSCDRTIELEIKS